MVHELKIWNGKAGCCRNPNDPVWTGIQPYRGNHRVYAAAYNRADLRRLIKEYCGRDPGETEIREYWNAGAWGRHMDGIAPERGLWLLKDSGKALPVRLI